MDLEKQDLVIDKVYYISYWSPFQHGSLYYKGKHPLFPDVLKRLSDDIARKLSFSNMTLVPTEAVVIINIIEVPAIVATEIQAQKLCIS